MDSTRAFTGALTDLQVLGSSHGLHADCDDYGPPLVGQWLGPASFERLFLGWEQYNTMSGDVHVWLDDDVVSTERAGCQQ